MKHRDTRRSGPSRTYVLNGYASKTAYLTRRPTWSPSQVFDTPDAATRAARAWIAAHQRDAVVEIGVIGRDTIEVVSVVDDAGASAPTSSRSEAHSRLLAGIRTPLLVLAALAVIAVAAYLAIAGARTIGSTTGFVVLAGVTALAVIAALLAQRTRGRR